MPVQHAEDLVAIGGANHSTAGEIRQAMIDYQSGRFGAIG